MTTLCRSTHRIGALHDQYSALQPEIGPLRKSLFRPDGASGRRGPLGTAIPFGVYRYASSFGYGATASFSDRADYSAGIACGEYPFGDISCHDAAGSNDGS